jgi:hypothetical protein
MSGSPVNSRFKIILELHQPGFETVIYLRVQSIMNHQNFFLLLHTDESLPDYEFSLEDLLSKLNKNKHSFKISTINLKVLLTAAFLNTILFNRLKPNLGRIS